MTFRKDDTEERNIDSRVKLAFKMAIVLGLICLGCMLLIGIPILIALSVGLVFASILFIVSALSGFCLFRGEGADRVVVYRESDLPCSVVGRRVCNPYHSKPEVEVVVRNRTDAQNTHYHNEIFNAGDRQSSVVITRSSNTHGHR